LIRRWASQSRLLVATQGPHGCTAFVNGVPHQVASPPVDEVDPTGAGDIFATALFVMLQRGVEPLKACAFANCIAATSVTRKQLDGLPTPEDVMRCSRIL
jgi:sugar/nucleoside kinase (ribokinase family)